MWRRYSLVISIWHTWTSMYTATNAAWPPTITFNHCRWSTRCTSRKESCRQRLCRWLDIMFSRLSCQHPLRLITMAFPFPIFLIRILDGYLLVHKVLPIHIRNCFIRSFEIRERNESVAFREICVISSHLYNCELWVTCCAWEVLPSAQISDCRNGQKYRTTSVL